GATAGERAVALATGDVPGLIDAVALVGVEVPAALGAAGAVEIEEAGAQAADRAGAEGADRGGEVGNSVLVREAHGHADVSALARVEHVVAVPVHLGPRQVDGDGGIGRERRLKLGRSASRQARDRRQGKDRTSLHKHFLLTMGTGPWTRGMNGRTNARS